MQSIYNHIPETNRDSGVKLCCSYSAVTVCATCIVTSHVECFVHVYTSTFQIVCAAPSMAGFCSSLISCFPGRPKVFRYFVNDFEMVPVGPIFTLYCYCQVFMFQNLLDLFLDHISVS